MRRISLLAPLPLAITGCVLQPDIPVAPDSPAPAAAPVVEVQLTVTPEEEPIPSAQTDVPLRVAPRDPVPFPIGAGYSALARVDFTGCGERGLPTGYIRVRATFNRVGYVAHASVEGRTAPPATALDCIADGLRQTGVPAFDGTDVRLSRTYFVARSAIAADASPRAADSAAP
jgi:hypothetical protein